MSKKIPMVLRGLCEFGVYTILTCGTCGDRVEEYIYASHCKGCGVKFEGFVNKTAIKNKSK